MIRYIEIAKKYLLYVFLSLSITGCLNLKPAPGKINYYSLEYEPPKISMKKQLPVVIRIERFRAAPFYDSNKIVFREKEFKKNAYVYHQWWTHPADMITYFLARDIKQSNAFKAVFTVDKSFPAAYVIEGMVDEFLEQDSPDSWEAVLSVYITLIAENEPDMSKKILLQKKYTANETCTQKTPYALAQAMSEAMAKISETVITDIYGEVRSVKSEK